MRATDSHDLGAIAARAIAAAGSGAALARAIGVTRFAVVQWKQTGIPIGRIGDVSAATGIPAAELRPDLAAQFASATP